MNLENNFFKIKFNYYLKKVQNIIVNYLIVILINFW